MQANGGQGNQPAVALPPNPQNAHQVLINDDDNMQNIEAQEPGADAQVALGLVDPVPLPAPYIPAGEVGYYDSDDDYEEPDPPLEFLE